jgi:hypothetical protein
MDEGREVMTGVWWEDGPITAHKKTAPESGAVASWEAFLGFGFSRDDHRPCSRAFADANGAPESECGYTDFVLMEHG